MRGRRDGPGLGDFLGRRGPPEGKVPLEAHQTERLVLSRNAQQSEETLAREKSLARLARLNAWSLAEFPVERRGLWQAGPWYPGFHWADSSPRARDGHAGVSQTQANRRGPKEACLARDTWRAAAAHDTTISPVVTGVVAGPTTSW